MKKYFDNNRLIKMFFFLILISGLSYLGGVITDWYSPEYRTIWWHLPIFIIFLVMFIAGMVLTFDPDD